MHALASLLAALALLATSADAKAKPRDAILLSQVSRPPPRPSSGCLTSCSPHARTSKGRRTYLTD